MSDEKPLTEDEQKHLKRNLVQIKQFLDQADATFFPDRPKILRSAVKLASEKMKQRANNLASGQGGGLNINPKIKERFGNFKGFGFFQKQEPQLSEEEQVIYNEQAQQLKEQAQARAKAEAENAKAEEERKKLQRARDNLGDVHISGN